MSRDLIYTCDICGEAKKPSNGWSLAEYDAVKTPNPRVVITRWNHTLASRKGIKHLCGTTCEAKFLTRITSEWRDSV